MQTLMEIFVFNEMKWRVHSEVQPVEAHRHQPVEDQRQQFQIDQEEVTISTIDSFENTNDCQFVSGAAPPVPGGRPAGQALPAPLIPS